MSLTFCIDAEQLRRALADIETAERNGFHHCLAVFDLTSASRTLSDCRATYSDLMERAHPTNPEYNWGRFQGVTRKCRFEDGRLIPLAPD